MTCLFDVGLRRGVPRIGDRNAEFFEIPHVTRNESESVLQGRGGNHAVRHTQWPTEGLAYPVKLAPPRSNRLRNRQHPPRK